MGVTTSLKTGAGDIWSFSLRGGVLTARNTSSETETVQVYPGEALLFQKGEKGHHQRLFGNCKGFIGVRDLLPNSRR
jgi:hypothetical protein